MKVKVKVALYTFIHRGVPVREDTYPEPSACEVEWPVPFLTALTNSQVTKSEISIWSGNNAHRPLFVRASMLATHVSFANSMLINISLCWNKPS